MPHGTRSRTRALEQGNNVESTPIQVAQIISSAEASVEGNDAVESSDAPSITVTMSPEHVARLRRIEADKAPEGGINIFHEHFAGIRKFPMQMLRVFVRGEIQKVEKWDEATEEQMHKDLTRAVPEMSTVMGGLKWPVPEGFSAKQVKESYLIFLRYFLDQYFQRGDDPVKSADEVEAVGNVIADGKVGNAVDVVIGAGPAREVDMVDVRGGDLKKKVRFDEDEARVVGRKRGRSRKGAKVKRRRKFAKERSSSSDSFSTDDSSSSSGSESDPDSEDDSSSSGSYFSSGNESSSSEEERRRKRRKRKKKRRAKRKRVKTKRFKRKRGRKPKTSRKSSKKKRVSFSDRVKAIQASQKVGAKKYSEEHLYRCQEVVKAYKTWANPRKRADKKATVPKTVRSFADRYLADPDSKIMEVYDLQHVKKNVEERKHVTFLMNKVGKLTSKIATARLERAQMALDKHNRLIEGAKLSRKAREESIERECAWAGKIRWYSEIIGEGEAKFYAAKAKLEEQKRLDNFRCAHPDVTESEAKRIVRKLADGTKAESGVIVSAVSGTRSAHAKEIKALKSKLGQLMRKAKGSESGSPPSSQSPNKDKKFKFECWHCKSKKHPVALCPVRAAGKPAVKGSYFWKQKQNDKTKE